MAQTVVIPGTNEHAKIREPVAVALLPFVTLGIYYLVWYYKINKEMAALGRATGRTQELGTNPTLSLIAVTFGAILVIPAIWSAINTFSRIQAAARVQQQEEPNLGIAIILFLFLFPAFAAYCQAGLNRAWRSIARPAQAQPAVA